MQKLLLRCGLVAALTLFIAAMAQAGPTKKVIVIDTQRMSLILYENQREIKRYPIAAGASGTPSPLGVFRVTNKFRTEMSGFGTRFLGLNVPWGIYGIHGTNNPGSIGDHASHGCFRMYVKDAEALYDLVPVGTTVIVEGGAYGELGSQLRTLKPGDRNAHVRAVQRKLYALGYDPRGLDGIYGAGLTRAIAQFRRDKGLPPVDQVDGALYQALGIMLFE